MTVSTGRAPAAQSPSPSLLCLLGGPYLVANGRTLAIPEGSKRLVAFVALQDRPVDRRQVAGSLWPDGEEDRASGNLRTAIWRLRGAGTDILITTKLTLSLRSDTEVDVHRLRRWADRLVSRDSGGLDHCLPEWGPDTPTLLSGWYDDWVLFERERLRQRMLNALELLSARQLEEGRYPDAVEAALRAVQLDPLRESAQHALIAAHLAEGNVADARRAYTTYRSVLNRELGVAPSRKLSLLLTADIQSRDRTAHAGCPTCPLARPGGANEGGVRAEPSKGGRPRAGRGRRRAGTVTPA